jgi:hypothetical protein
MKGNLTLWDAQDALLTALGEVEALAEVTVDFGWPVNVEPDHVWIDDAASGSRDTELSGDTEPSDETLRLTVLIFTSHALEAIEVRNLLKTLTAGVFTALASATFAAVVPSWTLADYTLDAGTDGTNRQQALKLTVECQCW